MAGRLRRPYERVRLIVQNQGSRLGDQRPRLIVIHSTEGHNRKGIGDLQNLGMYFNRPDVQASSHVAVDSEGNSAVYVLDERKAWTCAGFNSASLNIEMIGFSAQTEWPKPQVRKVAKYCAYWTKKYGIPVRMAKVNPNNGRIYRSGIIAHKTLGEFGGNHGDPGNHFPWRRLLWLTRYYRVKGY